MVNGAPVLNRETLATPLVGEPQEGNICATVFSWDGEFLQAKGCLFTSLTCLMVYTKCGQWQASFTQEILACLVELGVFY